VGHVLRQLIPIMELGDGLQHIASDDARAIAIGGGVLELDPWLHNTPLPIGFAKCA
jgi:hypothetical protein